MAGPSVLISGIGIAGPTLAYWLKRASAEVTLVERAPSLRSGGYVVDFWGLGYDIAERMGLAPDIERIGYHMREVRIVGDRGERLAGFGINVFDELTGGRFVTLARSDLSRLLFEKVKDEVETVFDDEIATLEETNDHVDVRFARGGERRFDCVIGADGLHSKVRQLAFGGQENFEKRLGYAVAAFEVSGYRPRDEDVYVLYSIPGRMVGRVTLRDDRALFLFVFTIDDTALPSTREAQKALLRERFGSAKWECPHILDDLDRAGDLYFDPVSQIKMPRWSKGRVALVGDAAFCVSLMAGQGSALAMTAAYVLAGEMMKAKSDYARAFANYEARLRDYIETKQKGAERFSAAFAPRTEFGLSFRNLVIKAFAIPGVARLALGREIIDRLELPEYGWGVSAALAKDGRRRRARHREH